MTTNFQTMQARVFNHKILFFLLAVAFLAFPAAAGNAAEAGDQGFIYGEITTKEGDSLKGPMRWGKEEAFWVDMFNATKIENEFACELSSDDMKERDKYSRSRNKVFGITISVDSDEGSPEDFTNHVFVCRFGELKRLKVFGKRSAVLILKNDKRVEVKGSSNDMNTDITILDESKGEITLDWDDIRVIEFMATPAKLKNKLGEPLYGTVKTEQGSFKGYIQWDHEECLSVDKLDGRSKKRKMSVAFGDIASIKKHRDGSMVTLTSGEEHYIYGTNDVDDDNRGIVINDPDYGKVLVDWDAFLEVTFDKNRPPMPAYDDFKAPKAITATVKNKKGKSFTGRIAYDLDEALDFEMLDGSSDDIQYYIPFRNITTIEPLGRDGSKVTLKSGKSLTLEDGHDVNYSNDGLLVWENEEPTYIPWQKIEKIKFEN
ncbi:MAG: hypothetical protein GY757_36805 [bacterium]|nr:hypothetical protein [bacterium]